MAQDTRKLLIEAAARLLDAGGPAAVTLREVGKRAGVSHNAPYKHFANKEELLAAVAARELAQQSKAMGETNGAQRPIDLLRTLMSGYIGWAMRYPARFKLTFGAWTQDSAELGNAATDARARLIEIVAMAQSVKQLPPGNPERIASLLLATAHGAADLALGGHLSREGKGAADAEDLADDLFALLKARAKSR